MKFAWIVEPPFNFAEDGRITGCDVELARLAFAAIGESFEPVETHFADLLPGLSDGRWQVTTGMFATPERATRAAFTRPIWALRDGLLVRHEALGRIDGYRSVAALGAKLAVLRDQVQDRTARELGVRPADIVVLEEYEAAARAVAEGEVVAYASVERAHLAHIARHPAAGLACVAVSAAEKAAEPGAFACSNSGVRDRLDQALDAFVGSDRHAALLRSFGLTAQEMPAWRGGPR